MEFGAIICWSIISNHAFVVYEDTVYVIPSFNEDVQQRQLFTNLIRQTLTSPENKILGEK